MPQTKGQYCASCIAVLILERHVTPFDFSFRFWRNLVVEVMVPYSHLARSTLFRATCGSSTCFRGSTGRQGEQPHDKDSGDQAEQADAAPNATFQPLRDGWPSAQHYTAGISERSDVWKVTAQSSSGGEPLWSSQGNAEHSAGVPHEIQEVQPSHPTREATEARGDTAKEKDFVELSACRFSSFFFKFDLVALLWKPHFMFLLKQASFIIL